MQSLELHLTRTIDRLFQKKKKILLLQVDRKRATDSPSRWGINSLVSMFARDGRGQCTSPEPTSLHKAMST